MSSDNTLMLSATRLRPGTGVASGQVHTTDNTVSGFTAVSPVPLGLTRLNVSWVSGGSEGYRIAFGPTAAAVDGVIAATPIFAVASGVQSFLMQPNDTGFKIQATPGLVANDLYWWVG